MTLPYLHINHLNINNEYLVKYQMLIHFFCKLNDLWAIAIIHYIYCYFTALSRIYTKSFELRDNVTHFGPKTVCKLTTITFQFQACLFFGKINL